MAEYALFFDAERCVGCFTCEVACKQENNIPVGPRWIRMVQIGPRKKGVQISTSFSLIRCRHCSNPPCKRACPVKAIYRTENGVVLINQELCTGCRACMEACPFGALQYHAAKGTVEKCTLCIDRIIKGLIPSCAKHCPYHALSFGDLNEIVFERQAQKLNRLAD